MPTDSSISPATKEMSTHTVSVKLFASGADVTQSLGGLLSLSVHKELNRIAAATIVIADGAVEKGKFEKSGSPRFAPGQLVEVQLGYQNQTGKVFKGLIVKHAVKGSGSRPSVLELECKDLAVHLTLIRKSRYFTNQTDKEIFREIIGAYEGKGVSVGNMTDTPFRHPELVQYHCTDWDFLVMRAEANGMVVFVEDGKIHIVKPEVARSADFDVTWGKEIIDFEAVMDARTHFPDVQVSTWNSGNPQGLSTEAGSGNTGSLGTGTGSPTPGSVAGAVTSAAATIGIDLASEDSTHSFPDVFYQGRKPLSYHGGDLATEELSTWALGQKTRGELSQVRGRIQVRGKDFKPLKTIEIKKLSGRFNGRHLVTGVMHQLYSGTWRSDIQFGMSAKPFAQIAPDIETPEASGLVPAIHGLHVGVVTRIESDNVSGDHRVKVKIPFVAAQGGSNEGVWARLSTLSAGSRRGTVFRPSIDDEVILGFINNDPNDAVVLGALHSAANTAPLSSSDSNTQQGYWAKNGMTLIFDEDKKSIELKTGQGYSVLLSEQDDKVELKDKHGNSIKLSASGIDLKSASDLSIEAAGILKIKGLEVRLNDP